jgi:protein-tyrosine phosphatase
MTKVLFVCMGNICRSPTAEGVFRHLVQSVGMEQEIHIDSAGTHDYHVGGSPDRRAQQAAGRRGYDLSSLRGRQVCPEDFANFDYVLAMDFDNLAILQSICPEQYASRVQLLMEFSEKFDAREVPDPYFGGTQGFEVVLDMVEDAAEGLLRAIRQRKQ